MKLQEAAQQIKKALELYKDGILIFLQDILKILYFAGKSDGGNKSAYVELAKYLVEKHITNLALTVINKEILAK
jgi:hypothetical protein